LKSAPVEAEGGARELRLTALFDLLDPAFDFAVRFDALPFTTRRCPGMMMLFRRPFIRMTAAVEVR
jgi:hypothetical protein